VIHLMAKRLGLAKQIDKHLHLLKRHLPYHESDHVLNLTYNVLAGGTRLAQLPHSIKRNYEISIGYRFFSHYKALSHYFRC
jgi:hypothetical protein